MTTMMQLVGVAMLASWVIVSTSSVVESREQISSHETEASKSISHLMTSDQTDAKIRNRRETGTGPEVDQSEDEDENETIVAVPEVKRFASFRSDLGKRKPFRSDLGRKRSGSYDVFKRFAAFRSDLGKRRVGPSYQQSPLSSTSYNGAAVDQKRYASFRSDLGKRLANSFDIDDDDDDDVEFDNAEKRFASFRSDLGKRRQDDDISVDDDGLFDDNDEKRYASFRSDLGKRRLFQQTDPLAEAKKATSHFRSDLGKRSVAFRTDLGKRNAGDEQLPMD